jgi:hypothetical protein
VPVFVYALDMNTAFAKLKDKYTKTDKMLLELAMPNEAKPFMKVFISKGKGYRLDLPDRIISSDYKYVWNYSVKDKTCIISDYEENLESMDTFFFKMLAKMKPVKLIKSTGTKYISEYILELEDKESGGKYKLGFSGDYVLKEIEIKDEMQDNHLVVKKIDTNPKDKSDFEIKTDDKVEIIDLR